MPLETIHIIVSLGVLVVTGILAYMGLKVKSEVSDSKNEILQGQLVIEGKLNTHVAEDNVIHEGFDRRITQIEAKR